MSITTMLKAFGPFAISSSIGESGTWKIKEKTLPFIYAHKITVNPNYTGITLIVGKYSVMLIYRKGWLKRLSF